MELRSYIILMQGSFYSKRHVLAIVTTYKKNTKERENVIEDLIKNERVPNRTALDKLLENEETHDECVKRISNVCMDYYTNNGRLPNKRKLDKLLITKENYKLIVEDMWGTPSPSELDCKLEKERIASITDTTAHIQSCKMKMVEQIKDRHLRRGYITMSKKDSRYDRFFQRERCRDNIIAEALLLLQTTSTPTEVSQYIESLNNDTLKQVVDWFHPSICKVKKVYAKT